MSLAIHHEAVKVIFRQFQILSKIGSALLAATVALGMGSPAVASPVARQGAFEFYDVRPDDSWQKIAATFGVPVDSLFKTNGVVNPARLASGQRLFIPATRQGLGGLQPPLQTLTGTTPWLAALAGNTPLTAVLLMNDISGPASGSVAYSYVRGQQQTLSTAPTPVPPPVIEVTEAPGEIAPGPPLTSSRMGIQGFFQLDAESINKWLGAASRAGFTWVKYQVNWKEHETPKGQYPHLETLDAFFEIAQRRKLNVLLSIAKAPEWARVTTERDGPPANYDDLASFAGFLASRYRSRLDYMQIAIEVWNEPNTQREWNGAPLSPQDYVSLLARTHTAIKTQDSRFIVISAGLAPTGINDGVIALDDRAYLRTMFQSGAGQFADAIGIHPYGWGNPPAVRCCNSSLGPSGYNDNPRFFFLNTIEDYRAIQAEYGISNLPLWATEFGWGTADHVGGPPADMPYVAYTSSDQQAQYIVDAYRWAQDQDYMGPMFLWNLNMAAYFLSDPDQSAYSIMFGLDSPQQAYNLIRRTPKQ